MDAHLYIPKNELREAVDYIWYHEATAVKLQAYNIPFLHQELIINFGERFSISDHQQKFDYHRAGGVTDIFSRPTVTTARGHYKAPGMMLKPYGLYRISGFSAAKLNGQPLTLQAIWGDAALAFHCAGGGLHCQQKDPHPGKILAAHSATTSNTGDVVNHSSV